MIKLNSKQIAEMVGGTLIGSQQVCVNTFSMNSREVNDDTLFLAYVGEKFDAHQFIPQVIEKGCRCLITKPLEDYHPEVDYIVVDDTNQAMLDLAREHRLMMKSKVIAITGSNGKTTTKDILRSICEQKGKSIATVENNNNEIGVAQTILKGDETLEFLILEAGVDKVGDMDLLSKMILPDYSIITSVGLAHVDNLGSVKRIAHEKCKIIQASNGEAKLFYQGDKTIIAQELRQSNYLAQQVSYGFEHYNDLQVVIEKSEQSRLSFSIDNERYTTSLHGSFQASNISAAILVAKDLGFTHEMIQSGIDHVQLTSLRLDLIPFKQATIIMDAYKSNPESAKVALDVLLENHSELKRAVFADMLGLGDETERQHDILLKQIIDANLDHVLFYGEHFKKALDKVSYASGEWYSSFEALKDGFYEMCQDSCSILIKGSRSFTLEKLLEGEQSI